MADAAPVTIPTPPVKPDTDELHKWAVAMNIFLNQQMGSGLQTTFLSSSQIADVNQKKDAGKIYYNHEDGTAHMTVVDTGTGNLVVKQITLT